MDNKYFLVSAYTSVASAILPSIFGFPLLRKKKPDPSLFVLWLLVVFAFVMDLLPPISRKLVTELGNTYRLFEFLFLLIIYYYAISNKSRNAFIAIGVAYVIFFFSDLLFFQAGQLNTFSITITAAVFIIFSVFHFFKLMKDLPSTHIHQLPMFWVDTAVLVYFAGAFFIFLLRNYLIEVLKDDQIVYWSLHNILNIIKNILFAVGLWYATKSPTVKSETR